MRDDRVPVEPLDGQMSLDETTLAMDTTSVLAREQCATGQDDSGPDREVETDPVGTADHTPGEGGTFGGPTANPNPALIPDSIWWLWQQLKELEPGSELGGIYADKSGYHNTRNRNRSRWPGNYSIREAEDQGGPADKAAALDWTFPAAQRGDYTRIALYTKRLVASGRDRNDPRLDRIREFYGQADSDSRVEGWDCRHLVDVTSDNSHLWHVHVSFSRSTVMDYAVMSSVLSVLRGEPLADWLRRSGTTPAPASAPVPAAHSPGSRELYWNRGGIFLEGDDVRFVQRWIGPDRMGNADGVAGPAFDAGVRWYQRMRGIRADGRVGSDTWDKWVFGFPDEQPLVNRHRLSGVPDEGETQHPVTGFPDRNDPATRHHPGSAVPGRTRGGVHRGGCQVRSNGGRLVRRASRAGRGRHGPGDHRIGRACRSTRHALARLVGRPAS